MKDDFMKASYHHKYSSKVINRLLFILIIAFIVLSHFSITNICRIEQSGEHLRVKIMANMSPIDSEPVGIKVPKQIRMNDLQNKIDLSIINTSRRAEFIVAPDEVKIDDHISQTPDSASITPQYNSIDRFLPITLATRVLVERNCTITLMDSPEPLLVIGGSSGLKYFSQISHFIEGIRGYFFKQFATTLPPRQAVFSFGVLFGSYQEFPGEFRENLVDTGLLHVVAASGYNLTILITIISKFCQTRFSKIPKYLLIFSALFIYCLFAGMTPSVLRAGVMATCVLLSQISGRLYHAKRALMLTALWMLIFNPLLIYDLSFVLSIAATFGILQFGGLIYSPASFANHQRRSWLQSVGNELHSALVTSVSASVFTVPILMIVFGRISVVGFFANALLLWLIPIIMLVAMIFLVCSIMLPFMATAASYPLWLVTTAFIQASEHFGSLPYASLQIAQPHWLIFPYWCMLVFFAQSLYIKTIRRQIFYVFKP